MTLSDPIGIDFKAPPFDEFKGLQRLATNRRGHASVEHARHQLYVGRHKATRTDMLIKVTSKPGLVYQHDLANERASLETINRELPESHYFPVVHGHGHLPDGRTYLVTSLFEELPLATAIGAEPMPSRTVAHLRTMLEVARAVADLHALKIFHVDLNPMNILRREEKNRLTIRIVDFESSYEVARHSAGEFYNPPTTPGYSAPEIGSQAPDARADLYSLGAVLYTMLAGFQWTWKGNVSMCVEADSSLDRDLKDALLSAVVPDRDKRYSSIQELHAALAAHLERIWPGRTW